MFICVTTRPYCPLYGILLIHDIVQRLGISVAQQTYRSPFRFGHGCVSPYHMDVRMYIALRTTHDRVFCETTYDSCRVAGTVVVSLVPFQGVANLCRSRHPHLARDKLCPERH